ncbi:hypothetical protein LEP1GSC193_3474 [Leptospira alstonii serovar Pingchang str. 80-412]|uniref:Uncharacterized protein n=2 Tax=Leptospira alstonii TaxID=28452 RepID=M6CKP2_9LEPT|nr:hypothetical protein LEP1GSC194_2738 [Leptospira alstonii serovar Sichuan str. 79601]EQA80676.1 hypothetical protein LEP1GSC193_3474 [Leptospira alstonii serovar Pingchang str. 80-412]
MSIIQENESRKNLFLIFIFHVNRHLAWFAVVYSIGFNSPFLSSVLPHFLSIVSLLSSLIYYILLMYF